MTDKVTFLDDHKQQDAFPSKPELYVRIVPAIRDTYNLTQKQLASLLSLHPNSLARIERGEIKPAAFTVDKLLILQNYSSYPGFVEMVGNMAREIAGDDAWLVVQLFDRVHRV